MVRVRQHRMVMMMTPGRTIFWTGSSQRKKRAERVAKLQSYRNIENLNVFYSTCIYVSPYYVFLAIFTGINVILYEHLD